MKAVNVGVLATVRSINVVRPHATAGDPRVGIVVGAAGPRISKVDDADPWVVEVQGAVVRHHQVIITIRLGPHPPNTLFGYSTARYFKAVSQYHSHVK